MTDFNPECVGSFIEYSNSQPGISEEALIVGYTKRLIEFRTVKSAEAAQSFDVALQAELSKLMVKGI